MKVYLQNIFKSLISDGWTATKGNYIEYEYYTGIFPENPSGNIENLKYIKYFDRNSELKNRIKFEYDLNDLPIKQINE